MSTEEKKREYRRGEGGIWEGKEDGLSERMKYR